MNKKTCKHCGYTWTPRIETEPKACPRCKSQRWNEPLRNPGRPKGQKGDKAMNIETAKENILRMTEYKTEAEIEDFLQDHSSEEPYGALLSALLCYGWTTFDEMLRR